MFHRDARALAWRLASIGGFSAIVAVTRGGLVPAGIVARELGIRVIETVCVASYHEETERDQIEVLKPLTDTILSRPSSEVLIIDDLVDTGATAKAVREMLPKVAFRDRLRQAAGPADGRHFRHRSLAGHLDLLPLGHGPVLSGADPRAGAARAARVRRVQNRLAPSAAGSYKVSVTDMRAWRNW